MHGIHAGFAGTARNAVTNTPDLQFALRISPVSAPMVKIATIRIQNTNYLLINPFSKKMRLFLFPKSSRNYSKKKPSNEIWQRKVHIDRFPKLHATSAEKEATTVLLINLANNCSKRIRNDGSEQFRNLAGQ